MNASCNVVTMLQHPHWMRVSTAPAPDRPNKPPLVPDDTPPDDPDDVPPTPPDEPPPVPIEDPKPAGQPPGPYIA